MIALLEAAPSQSVHCILMFIGIMYDGNCVSRMVLHLGRARLPARSSCPKADRTHLLQLTFTRDAGVMRNLGLCCIANLAL